MDKVDDDSGHSTGRIGKNCMYYFGGHSWFTVHRIYDDMEIKDNHDCVSASAKLVMTNVKFEYFGM